MSLALGQIPKGAKEPVGQKLATLDQQVAQAYGQWNSQEQSSQEALGQLKQQRAETIRSMGEDIQNAGGQAPGDVESMAQCQMMQDQATQEGQEGGAEDGQQVQGPVASDFVNIEDVQPNASKEEDPGGSFETKCGNNENEHFNSDNVIAAPGVLNGAHHVHDYVGNEDTNQASSDESLAAANTTCAKGDQSTHYWPVIRSLDGNEDQRGAVQEGDVSKEQSNQGQAQPQGQRTGDDAGQDQGEDQGQEQPPAEEEDQGQDQGQEQPPAEEEPPAEGQDQGQDQGQGEGEDDQVGGGQGAEAQPGDGGANDLNIGTILTPDPTIKLTSGGADQVIEMPRFLRIITGDAKSFTNGDENANASWSCEGFEDRQLTDKYPLCPEGKKMIRTFKFQNCWDGQNTDSGNHRDHMKFSDDQGNCPEGFQNIPQVQQTIKYDIPQQNLLNTDTPFAVDSFPEQLHKAITDHSDFINVMPKKLMEEAVDCINEDKECPGESEDTGGDEGTDSKPDSGSKPDDSKPSDSDKDKPDSKPSDSKGDSGSKPDESKPDSGSKPDDSTPSDSKPDSGSNSDSGSDSGSKADSGSKSDDSTSSDANQDKQSSASDSKSDDSKSSDKALGNSTPEAVNRDNPVEESDESTQLAKEQDSDLAGTGSNTPIGLIVGIAAAIVAAGSAQVWYLRRRNAARD